MATVLVLNTLESHIGISSYPGSPPSIPAPCFKIGVCVLYFLLILLENQKPNQWAAEIMQEKYRTSLPLSKANI